MRRLLPFVVMVLLVLSAIAVYIAKEGYRAPKQVSAPFAVANLKDPNSCIKLPPFLAKLHISNPVLIDLSQQRFKGLALLFDKQFSKALHPKQWEQYGHLGTYALTQKGDIYLTPMPYISIQKSTFNLQKNLYKLDGKTGKLSIGMHFEDVEPNANNPYGIVSLAYDCSDHTLWVGAIDETSYRGERGVIYHIDPEKQKILEKIAGVDALSLKVLVAEGKKYLFVGSAYKPELSVIDLSAKKRYESRKLIELPDPTLRIRKIKRVDADTIKLEAIPFGYTLLAQSDAEYRKIFFVDFDKERGAVLHAR